MFNGEKLAQCLTAFGLPCSFKERQLTPRTTIYHFDFSDWSKVTKGRINNAVQRLSMYSRREFSQVESTVAQFAIAHEEANQPIVPLGSIALPEEGSASFVAGINQQNEQVNISLDKMVHALVAGTTGSGKSVFLKSFIYTLLAQNKPRALNIAIIDKKMGLNFWGKASHCMAVANDDRAAIAVLDRFQNEMYRRYAELNKRGLEKNNGLFPKWVLVVDELADLMLTERKAEIENKLVSLCQLGRAAGIHCVLCTQSPRVAVVSGLIQANTPTKIIFKTANTRESVLCLGHSGAEKLLGNGDCLVKLPDRVNEMRVQAPFASESEFRSCVE